MNDKQDTEDATRGKLAELSDPLVKAADGRIVWDTQRYDFIKGDAPATVNPSLWRQQTLNTAQGLFKVADGIYQIRGYDIANMTLVEGATGWIVIDTMLTADMAKAGLKLAMEHAEEQQAGGRGDLHAQPRRPLRRRARRRRRGRRALGQGQDDRARRLHGQRRRRERARRQRDDAPRQLHVRRLAAGRRQGLGRHRPGAGAEQRRRPG